MAAAVLTSSVLAFVVVAVGPDWNWDLGLGPDWNWYRRPSLSPQASPVGASVAFAKVQIQFLFCYLVSPAVAQHLYDGVCYCKP